MKNLSTDISESPTKKRGRPPKNANELDTKTLLIRCGIELLTERGYMTSDIDSILKKTGVPKGSFYYHFKNKEDFGRAVILGYHDYFKKKLTTFFMDESVPPLQRIVNFYENAKQGMQKFHFQRGCLIGNVAQEATILPDSYYSLLNMVFKEWQAIVEQCFLTAQSQDLLPPNTDCTLLANVFWMGWEGAVMRAKLEKSEQPLTRFIHYFLHSIKR